MLRTLALVAALFGTSANAHGLSCETLAPLLSTTLDGNRAAQEGVVKFVTLSHAKGAAALGVSQTNAFNDIQVGLSDSNKGVIALIAALKDQCG